MKRVFQGILFFAILLQSSSSAQWKWQNPVPGGNRLTALKFVDQSKVFAVGNSSTILKSTNAGQSWQSIDAGQTGDINDVDSYGANLLIAVGQGGLILRSSDGGGTWTSKILSTQTNLMAVSIISTNLVVVTGGTRIFKSTDGGISWSAPVTPSLVKMQDILLVNNQTGYAVGNGFYRSTDGSASYVKMNIPITGQFVSIASPSISAIYLASASTLFCSTDGGTNWDTTAKFPDFQILKIYFVSNSLGYVIGTNGAVYKTDDGGATWSNLSPDTTLSAKNINGIAVSSAGDLLICGDGGVLYKRSADQWNSLMSAVSCNNITDISFVSNMFGLACGDSGCIVKTTDGGANWARKSTPIPASLKHIIAIDQQQAFVFGSAGFKTTDGGENWQAMRLPDSIMFLGGYFFSGSVGYACGENGTIVKTEDAGVNWDVMSSGSTEVLHSLCFISRQIGFCAGNNVLLKTTDAGQTWVNKLSSAGHLNSIAFKDQTTGIAVGGSADTVCAYMTTDGGESWAPILSLPNAGLCVASYLPSGAVLVAGWNGTILKSTNDGSSWVSACYQTSETIEGLSVINDSTMWACGHGTILSTVAGSYTEVNTLRKVVSYRLDLRNYPNPFNPSTVITYTVPVRARVVLKIYDIAGREILRFDEGEKMPGHYEKIFNAAGLSSGIYFCSVSTGNLSMTRKLLLLK